jgi:hypothetical protein
MKSNARAGLYETPLEEMVIIVIKTKKQNKTSKINKIKQTTNNKQQTTNKKNKTTKPQT